MPRARKEIVDPSSTPYYHCTSTCVRQMYLCGYDQASKKSFEHRRQWIVDRIEHLAKHFSIGVCAYAIMHNHYHIVLKLGEAKSLTNAEVIQRWTSVYRGSHPIIKRLIAGTASASDKLMARKIIAKWRERLSSISWFMRALNEPIAKRANKESGHRGHFWESRFHSQALLDDFAMLGCMVYVDLNPIRAKMANSLNESDYTSIQQRIHLNNPTVQRKIAHFKSDITNLNTTSSAEQRSFLLPLRNIHDDKVITFSLAEYIELVKWSGQLLHPRKRGHLAKDNPTLLRQLKIAPKLWQRLTLYFEKGYFGQGGKANRDSFSIATH